MTKRECHCGPLFPHVIASRRRGNPGGGVFLEIAELVANPSVEGRSNPTPRNDEGGKCLAMKRISVIARAPWATEAISHANNKGRGNLGGGAL